ncbi:MAG: hypothetical protein IH948_00360 [Bacteroidetes bacterium]|nr:hypothetical protein [Bacteroidota bacterium]
MAYSEFLADRVSAILRKMSVQFEAIKMMGGLCYMIDDKMCCGISNDRLINDTR